MLNKLNITANRKKKSNCYTKEQNLLNGSVKGNLSNGLHFINSFGLRMIPDQPI